MRERPYYISQAARFGLQCFHKRKYSLIQSLVFAVSSVLRDPRYFAGTSILVITCSR